MWLAVILVPIRVCAYEGLLEKKRWISWITKGAYKPFVTVLVSLAARLAGFADLKNQWHQLPSGVSTHSALPDNAGPQDPLFVRQPLGIRTTKVSQGLETWCSQNLQANLEEVNVGTSWVTILIMYITVKSLFCILETNKILYMNYTSIKNISKKEVNVGMQK